MLPYGRRADDIADGIYKAMKTDHVNAVYNISTQTEISINHILEIFARISGRTGVVQG